MAVLVIVTGVGGYDRADDRRWTLQNQCCGEGKGVGTEGSECSWFDGSDYRLSGGDIHCF